MAKDPQVVQEEKRREEERSRDAGKPDSEIGFGGSIIDIGEKDAKGVGRGK